MACYRVAERCAARREILLLDAYGQLHLARLAVTPPAPGTVLHGTQPGAGFQWLTVEISGQVHRCDFVLVSCGRDQAVARWRVAEPVGAMTTAPFEALAVNVEGPALHQPLAADALSASWRTGTRPS